MPIYTPDATATDPIDAQPQETTPQEPAASPAGVSAQTPPAASPAPGNAQPQASQAQQSQMQAPTPQQNQPNTVSNVQVPRPPAQSDPAIQHAGRFYQFAQALAGGPRYAESIDPTTGTTTRTQVPLSRGDLGMAIALEAISGALSGLTQTGPGATGRAAAAGFQTTYAQQQQARQQQEQQAQADAKAKSDAIVRAANIADINSRTLLSTAEAEGRGADILAKIAETNKPLIASYDEAGQVIARNVTQAELLAGMQGDNPKYNATSMLGPIDGYRLLGDGRVEATHAVVMDPTTKVELTPEMWKDFANNHVQGFPKTTYVGQSVFVPGTAIARANEQKTMFQLAQQRHDEVSKALSESDDPSVQALAAKVPSISSLLDDPRTGAGLATALTRYQSYVSHADISHGGRDLYESLQAMAQPSRPDPNDPKKTIPNRDAPFASQVAQAFGGWDVLEKYHYEVAPLELKSADEAADMIAGSEPGSRAYKYAQRFLATLTQHDGAVAGAKASAQAHVDAQVTAQKPTAASLNTPDALGFVPTVSDTKEANKRFGGFKKNLDALSQSEQSYQQFQQAIGEINSGHWTGADSVVALFNAIGLSATPLAGRGFRVSQNVIAEHQTARGWEGALQAKLLGAQTGAIITPTQLKDYAAIASQSRASQIVATANEMHAAGIPADAALPTGNGQKISRDTAAIFFKLAGNNPIKARQAATAKGWTF